MDVRNNLYLGYEGSDNSMTISDGGAVVVEQSLYIGYHELASNSTLSLTDQDSELSADYILFGSSNGKLDVVDGAKVTTYGVQIASGDENLIRVSGVGAELHAGNMDFLTDENSLEIVDGGVVTGKSFVVHGHQNSTTVSGNGSSLLFSEQLEVYGSKNILQVSDAAQLQAERLYLFGNSNQMTVEGIGSRLDLGYGQLLVDIGASNLVEVSGGGNLSAGSSFIGVGASSNNIVVVSGTGSQWDNAFDLGVGSGGSNNKLHISDGGSVINSKGVVGWNSSSTCNEVLIDGYGSVWGNSQDLHVGYGGANNALYLTDGGLVSASNSYIGTMSDNNQVLVQHSGSVWSNAAELYIGYGGGDNLLRIFDGGQVESGNAYVGYDAMASGNSVEVRDAGSYWFSKGGLHVGYAGSENTMRVENGSQVQAWGNSSIGYAATANSNQVVVSGPRSAWGVGAMVPRYVVLPPTYPPVPGGGSGGSVGGGVIIIGQPPIIGYPGGGNSLIITNGGSFASGGEGLYIGSSNLVSIGGGSFTGGSGGVLVGGGASVVSYSDSPIFPGNFPTQVMIMASFGELSIGREGSFNSLDIDDGGLVACGSAFIGETSNAWFNTVSVTGSNSEFKAWNDLSIGGRMSQTYYMTSDGWENSWIDGGRGNSLHVGDGGLVSVGHDMHNRNYSTLTLDGKDSRIEIGGDYYQDATAWLRFGVDTNASGAPETALISVDGTAEFEKDARIEYASNVGELQFDTFYTNKLIEADRLVVAGVENADSLDLEMLDASGSLVDVLFWEYEQDIYALAGRKYLAESAGFADGSMMARLAKEIDDMSLLGDADASDMIYLLNTMSGAQQNAQLTQQYGRNVPSFMHIQGMTEGLGEITKHASRRSKNAPEGVAGPYSADRGMRGWIKTYGSWAERSSHGGFSGYDHDVYGTIVGIDQPLDTALVGVAGGYAHSRIDQDDNDRSEAKTGYAVVYASFGTEDWFGDVNLAYGRSSVEDRSGTVFGAEADYKASNYALYLGGGKEMQSRDGLFVFTPEASLLMSYYSQEDYTEEAGVGVVREVEWYEHHSAVSMLGATVAMQLEQGDLVFEPETYLRWMHEFNADEERLDFTLLNGLGGKYSSVMPAAEEDMLEAGAGLSCIFKNEATLSLGVSWRIGEDYDAYSVGARATAEF